MFAYSIILNSVDGYIQVDISNFIIDELLEWCEENCKNNWEHGFGSFYFKDKTEATMFALIAN
jgi:hypothetical protein